MRHADLLARRALGGWVRGRSRRAFPSARSPATTPNALIALQGALGNHVVRRLLDRQLQAPGRRLPASGAPVLQRDEGKGKDKDKDKDKGGDKPAEKAAGWSRKLTSGPDMLNGSKASYQVWFDHVLPPVPAGVTQLWQVVESKHTLLTDKCTSEAETDWRVDIVKIGTRTAINDTWGWLRRDDPCFAREVSQATVGFDDKKSKYAEQVSVKVSETDAKDLLGKMAGPKGTFSGTYTFVKSGNCKDCPEKLKPLKEKSKAPDGEALAIDGVGSWPS